VGEDLRVRRPGGEVTWIDSTEARHPAAEPDPRLLRHEDEIGGTAER
jgi:hypothetical protein